MGKATVERKTLFKVHMILSHGRQKMMKTLLKNHKKLEFLLLKTKISDHLEKC